MAALALHQVPCSGLSVPRRYSTLPNSEQNENMDRQPLEGVRDPSQLEQRVWRPRAGPLHLRVEAHRGRAVHRGPLTRSGARQPRASPGLFRAPAGIQVYEGPNGVVLKPSRAYWFLTAENTSSKTGETGKGLVCGSLRGRLQAPGAAGAAGCPEASLPRLRLQLGLETQQRCGWRAGRGPHAAGCRLTSPCSLRPSLPAAHPAQAQGRPTATVSPLRAQSLPAVGSPQHSPRPAVPLTSAASAVTPPNVSAVHLNGEAGAGPAGGRSAPSPTSAGGRPDERRSERFVKETGLLPERGRVFGGLVGSDTPPPSSVVTGSALRGAWLRSRPMLRQQLPPNEERPRHLSSGGSGRPGSSLCQPCWECGVPAVLPAELNFSQFRVKRKAPQLPFLAAGLAAAVGEKPGQAGRRGPVRGALG
ncbi:hypothetical protein J1605_005669 [Eschrichtius robustus]|uniref:Uncharacterized protein n=1 Tax=Eschrichtius robustus TaxID=9764 RepID=A0AB34HAE5_ESCRO|nr:hypothetical protein J1605_005669 [Eschrichtius robustus]